VRAALKSLRERVEPLAAVRVLDDAQVPAELWRNAIAQLLDSGAADDVIEAATAAWLKRTTWAAPELPPPLVVRLAQVPTARAHLAVVLARSCSDTVDSWHTRLSTAARELGYDLARCSTTGCAPASPRCASTRRRSWCPSSASGSAPQPSQTPSWR
jgi:hypothetical protein